MSRGTVFLSAGLLLALCLVSIPSHAQGGEIGGNVWMAGSNRPPEGALITLSSSAGDIIQQRTPEGSGRFEFVNLIRGIYYVTVRAPGYQDATQRADIFSIRRLSLFFTMVPVKEDRPPLPPAEQALIDERQLRIPKEARKEFEKGARELFEKKKPEASLAHFRKALEIYPEYYEADYLMGTAYMDQKKFAEAEQSFKESLKTNDRHAASYFALGALYNQQGRAAEAAPLLLQGVDIKGDAWQGRFELAQSYLALGRLDDAEAHARRAHELAPGFPPVHVVLANTLLRKNDLPSANEEFQHYLKIAPEGPLAAEVKARVAEIEKQQMQPAAAAPTTPVPAAAQKEFREGGESLQRGQMEAALAHYRKATEIHPAYVEAHHMTGTVLLQQGELAGAEAAFHRCLDIDDRYAPSYVGLGVVLNEQGKPEEAAAMLQKAVESDASSWQAHFELAQTRLALHQVSEAESHAQRAHELQPGRPMVHVLLGNVFLAERKLAPARDEYQHYVDLAPTGPLAGMLKEKIRAIDRALAKPISPPPN